MQALSKSNKCNLQWKNKFFIQSDAEYVFPARLQNSNKFLAQMQNAPMKWKPWKSRNSTAIIFAYRAD